MAQDIVGGLFGITPEMYQQNVGEDILNQGVKMGQLAPDAFGRANVYAGAAQIGRGIAGAMGAEDPQLKLISIRNAVGQSIDPNDPATIQRGIQQLASMGDQEGAMRLADYLRKAQGDYALIQQRTAEKLTPNVRDALAYAGSVAPQGTEEFNTAYQTKLNEMTSKAENKPPTMVGEFQFAKSPEGGGFKGTYQEFVTARALAGRAPAQPRAEHCLPPQSSRCRC